MKPVIKEIALHQIHTSPMNPRKTFDPVAIRELADNIKRQGLLQPITVRPTETDSLNARREREGKLSEPQYEIVCGERRFRACCEIQMLFVPCIVREMTDDEAFDAMITENLQRRDVDPIEEAVAFRLLQERGQSANDLAARFGKSVRYIQDRMRLGSLLEPIRRAVSKGEIPIRGGYLLARLSTDDQQAWLDEEWDENAEGDIAVGEIEDWLNRHFRNLWRAPFQNCEHLSETWNPDGSLIRRCYDCDCNTLNQGCLFADMNTEQPQCINATCYNRKLDVYYDYLIRREAKLILCGNEKPQPHRVALIGDEANIYNDDAKARFRQLKERCEAQGYAVFTDRQLPTRLWSNGEEEFRAGRAIRCLDLSEMARGYASKPEYRRIPGTPSATSTASNYPAQLSERAAAIESKAERKIENYAKKNFDRGKYIARTAALEEWEKDIITAIIFDYVDCLEKDKLIAGTTYKMPTIQQIQQFSKQQELDGNRWMRRAIARFLNKAYNNSYMEEALRQLDPLAAPTFSKIRKDADKRIKDIHDELRELGYDEHANKL